MPKIKALLETTIKFFKEKCEHQKWTNLYNMSGKLGIFLKLLTTEYSQQ